MGQKVYFAGLWFVAVATVAVGLTLEPTKVIVIICSVVLGGLMWRPVSQVLRIGGLSASRALGLGSSLDIALHRTVPLYDGQGRYCGDGVRPNVAAMQDEVAYLAGPGRYRAMYDALPHAYGFCEIVGPFADGLDFTVIDANQAFYALFGITDLPCEAVSEADSRIFRHQPDLFKVIKQLQDTGSASYSNWFVALSRHLRLQFTLITKTQFCVLVSDETDLMLHQREILRLNGHLDTQLASRVETVSHMVSTTDEFLQNAIADLTPLHEVLDRLPVTEQTSEQLPTTITALHRTMQTLMRYGMVTTLNFRADLVDVGQVADEVFTTAKGRYPHVAFKQGIALRVVCARAVLHAIFNNCVQLFCEVLAVERGSVVELGVRGEFLSEEFYVTIAPYATAGVTRMSEPASFVQPRAAMQLGVCSRLALYHGGALSLERTEVAVTVKFALNEPLSWLALPGAA